MIQKIIINNVTFIREGSTTIESGARFAIFGILTNAGYVDYQTLIVEQTDNTFTTIYRDKKVAIISPNMYIRSPNGKLDFLLESQKVIFNRNTCKDKHGNHLAYDKLILEALTAASNIWNMYKRHENI